jgi:hypothetical protein
MRVRCGLCNDCQCQCQCQGLGGSQSRLWGKLTCAFGGFGASVNSRFPAKYPTARVEPPPCSDWIATRNATGVPSNAARLTANGLSTFNSQNASK